jgi:hypothetical protein
MLSKETYLNIVSIIGIIAASLVVVTVGELRIFDTAQGQRNLTSSLTPQNKKQQYVILVIRILIQQGQYVVN